MKTKTKQTTRTGTELGKWTSHGGFSVGRGGEEWGNRYKEEAKLVGIKQMGRGKKWYRNQRIQRTYKYNPGT